MIKNMIEKIEAEIKELNKRIERKTGDCFFDESRSIDRLNERIENKQCMKELLLKPEFDELERLAEIGRATEKAFDENGGNVSMWDGDNLDIFDVEDLLKWYKESEE